MVRTKKTSYDFLGYKGEVEVELPDPELPDWPAAAEKKLAVVGKAVPRRKAHERVT
ncbi:MAG: hypothetical protein GTN78_21485, partial [Gemmatimonadales bacterium]|nr:hypothetical protein [Gemmatimonadales bacterium]